MAFVFESTRPVGSVIAAGISASEGNGAVHREEVLDRLRAAGSVPLGCLTEEELAAVEKERPAPFQPAEAQAGLRELPPQTRRAVVVTALRGLMARGLLEPPAGPGWPASGPDGPVPLVALDELAVILGVRHAPTAMVLVRQESFSAVLHGFREERLTGSAPGTSGFLEERTDQLGLHHFTVRTTDNAIDALTARADAAGAAPAQARPDEPALTEIPVAALSLDRGRSPGETLLDACHARPAGGRRIRARIQVRPGEASVAWSVSGVEPEPPRGFAVSADGLRRVIREALCDPAGDAPGGNGAPAPATGTATGEGDEMAGSDGPPYQCPVCGYLGLEEPARSAAGHPSWEICPSCGFEFGYDDDDAGRSYADWRQEWIAEGMPWRMRSRRPPRDWDPRAQLRTLPGSGGGAAGRSGG